MHTLKDRTQIFSEEKLILKYLSSPIDLFNTRQSHEMQFVHDCIHPGPKPVWKEASMQSSKD